MKTHLSVLAAIIVVSAGASMVQADPLLPGSTLFPAPVVTPPAPATFVTSASGTYSVAGHFSGSVTVSVYNEGAGNPLGGLTFVYSVSNDQGSPNSVERVTTDNFASYLVDAGYSTLFPPAGPVSPVPNYIDRSNSGDVPGFGWLSPNGIGAGTTTPMLILRTNAQTFTPDTVNIIDGESYTVQQLLGPAPVPEPASLALLAGGGLLLLRRRR